MKFDAVVIGAGPGGATCAWELARKGAKVLIVDFKRRPGIPVQCAEFVPLQLKHRYPHFFIQDSVAQEVESMVHFTPWGEVVTMPSPGFVLNRDIFDSRIVDLAVSQGAEIMLRTFFRGFDNGNVILENVLTRETVKVRADFIIGADGPRSRTARLTGYPIRSFLATAQFMMPLLAKLKDLLIFFRDYIPGGYGWVFPKGDKANVGVGVDPEFGVNVMNSLKRFKEEVTSSGIVANQIISRTGGWIPAEGPVEPSRGKVLLVGDAGGFCHPITGGGIANAVLTGSLAAQSIIEGDPEEYGESSMDFLGESLTRAARKRIKYMKRWDDLEFIIPKTWIAFEEYWKED